MKFTLTSHRTLGLVVLASALAGCHRDTRQQPTTFEMEDAWVRAAPDSGSTTAAYIRFVNGTADTMIVSHFSSNDARAVELHESSTDSAGGSHMAMRDSLVIAPAHTLVMRPGGYHLMLIGTTHSLAPGKMIRIVMHLSNGAIVATSARVQP